MAKENFYIVVNAKALSIMRYQLDINTEHNMKSIGRPTVAHLSMDKAPDSQWINAGSKLERRKYTFITLSHCRAAY